MIFVLLKSLGKWPDAVLNMIVSVPSKFLTTYSSGSSESSLSGFAAGFFVNFFVTFFCVGESEELEDLFLSF
jgi:hypothetical protein